MKADLEIKRQEVLAFIIIAVIAALLVSLLANIIFTAFYKIAPHKFSLIVLSGLIFVSLFSYSYVLIKKEQTCFYVSFPLLLDRKSCSFIDVPHSIGSVHSRFHFDRLPHSERLQIIETSLKNLWNSELHIFVDDTLQAIFMNYLLANVHMPNLDEE